MNGWVLTLKHAPSLRVELRGVLPSRLAPLNASEVEHLPLGYGNRTVPLAEFFKVAPGEPGTLRLVGDCTRVDRIGWQLDAGRIVVEGSAGHHAGGAMRGGELQIAGDAGLHAGCQMGGGRLEVGGSVGDFAGAALPGNLDGMTGGTLLVRGNAGERFADRMRRGSALVFGSAGAFCASRMVAGTIAIGGNVGPHLGYGMRRGSVVLASAMPSMPGTFVPAVADAPVAWQLIARDLARHGGPFAGLPARSIARWLGDLSADGKGEIIVPR